MNPENSRNINWKTEGTSFSSKTMKQLSALMQRISSIVSLNSKWLSASLNSKHSQFEKEGNNYLWIDKLVNRLESSTMFHVPDFQRDGYESARSVKYRWYDPRHWLNSFLQIDPEEPGPDEPGNEQFTDITENKPLAVGKVYSGNSVAAKITKKYLKDHRYSIEPAAMKEASVMKEPAEAIPASISAPIIKANHLLKQNKPAVEVQSNPVGLIHPVTTLPPADNDPLHGMLHEDQDYDVLPGVNKEENAITQLAEIKHKSTVAGKIQGALSRFFNNMNKTDAVPGSARISDPEKPANTFQPFLKKYFSNKFDYSGNDVSPEFREQAFESYFNMENPVVPQITGLPGDSADVLLQGIASRPEYSAFESVASIPPYVANENNMILPFADSQPAVAQAFSINSPFSASALYAPANLPAAAGNIAHVNGISQGAAYLAMAPLLRPMPAELALRPMPEELRDTGTAESAEETTTQQREPAYDPEVVAAEVYAIIKRRILVEKERSRGSI